MRYRLRTLLIALALGPMMLAAAYWHVQQWRARRAAAEAKAAALAKAEQNRLALEALNRWYSSVVLDRGWRSHYEPQVDSPTESPAP